MKSVHLNEDYLMCRYNDNMIRIYNQIEQLIKEDKTEILLETVNT